MDIKLLLWTFGGVIIGWILRSAAYAFEVWRGDVWRIQEYKVGKP